MQHGCCVIGDENKIIHSQITDVLSLTIVSSNGSTSNMPYDLEKLQDFESRLVLIAGQSTENTEEVQKFLNVSI